MPIPHKIAYHDKNNTAHKATQIIKDTLHAMNKMQRENKAILVTGREDCEILRIPHCPDSDS
jgi:hypothetical protein